MDLRFRNFTACVGSCAENRLGFAVFPARYPALDLPDVIWGGDLWRERFCGSIFAFDFVLCSRAGCDDLSNPFAVDSCAGFLVRTLRADFPAFCRHVDLA